MARWPNNLPKKRDECWFMMAHQSGTAHQLRGLYGRRMTIEQLFPDDKSEPNGWSPRDTKVTTPEAEFITGLAAADVFYFGNAVGESGDAAANAIVNATDVLLARNNARGAINPAPVTFPYDFNRDKLVNATDQIIARGNTTSAMTALRLITPTVPAGGTLTPVAPASLSPVVTPQTQVLRSVWSTSRIKDDEPSLAAAVLA